MFLFFMMASALAATETKPKAEEIKVQPKFCITLDERVGFHRCETTEVVCYVVQGGASCWNKPPAVKETKNEKK